MYGNILSVTTDIGLPAKFDTLAIVSNFLPESFILQRAITIRETKGTVLIISGNFLNRSNNNFSKDRKGDLNVEPQKDNNEIFISQGCKHLCEITKPSSIEQKLGWRVIIETWQFSVVTARCFGGGSLIYHHFCYSGWIERRENLSGRWCYKSAKTFLNGMVLHLNPYTHSHERKEPNRMRVNKSYIHDIGHNIVHNPVFNFGSIHHHWGKAYFHSRVLCLIYHGIQETYITW